MSRFQLPAEIFRAYDIRGIYPEQLQDIHAYIIGCSLAIYLKSKLKKEKITLHIGNDNRESSPTLVNYFILGLQSHDINVVYVGITLTPIMSYIACTQNTDFCVMVTASHNPKQYNGFRFIYKHGSSLYGDELKQLYTIAQNQIFPEPLPAVTSLPPIQSFNDIYVDDVAKRVNINYNGNVLIDCGNATSGLIVEQILNKLEVPYALRHCNLDSSFPLGTPDPERDEFMQNLATEVVDAKAAIGFAFDTDADRFGLVDENGIWYSTDKLLAVLARHYLPLNENKTVIFDVKSSSFLEKIISDFEGTPKMIRTGHPYFFEEMQKGALMAAEYSGHMYFNINYFGFDDGIFAMLMFLDLLSSQKCNTSSLFSAFPTMYVTHEIKIPCEDIVKFNVMEQVMNLISSVVEITDLSLVDGVRCTLGDLGWFLIRASNTTPFLTIRMEAKNEDSIATIKSCISQLFETLNIDTSPIVNAPVIQN
ncbi:MAG: phosphomannomutase/phosphoglucomutase [Patescibacteria group bacterium]|uniref:Phosphomannomutase/phosphoglucomutase n=1 Tax=candidate division WWE3 bacterium TaxID=2053526 RepID=A0A955ECI3_UNCKA|nr:phosphomannomutase/phosphoglucomutase [candidate division WWE3 bacterium]